MMERTEILATMADLKLYGMRAAYDELMAMPYILRERSMTTTAALAGS
jgi:hypothetical protein